MNMPTTSPVAQLATPVGRGVGVGVGIRAANADADIHGTGVELELGPATPVDRVEPHPVSRTATRT
ncbi:MAG TPA: hypothetical protein VF001_07220, partial [Candidatus Limnocylindria bacterium]